MIYSNEYGTVDLLSEQFLKSLKSDEGTIGMKLSGGADTALLLYLVAKEISERNLKLPVIFNNKNCTNRFGCNSLSDGDTVRVNGYSDDFTVTLYENDTLNYIPVI